MMSSDYKYGEFYGRDSVSNEKLFTQSDHQLYVPKFLNWDSLKYDINYYFVNGGIRLQAQIKVINNHGRKLYVENKFTTQEKKRRHNICD